MKSILSAVVLVSSACLVASGALGGEYDKVVKERKALMKSISKDNKALKKAAKAGNLDAVEKDARRLASQFAQIANPCLFPKGSGAGTRAKPAVWTDWADFSVKATAARRLALLVAAEANAGQTDQAMASVKSLSKQACGSCHKVYRAPKKKKM